MVVTWVDIFLVNILEGILYTNILYKGSDGNLEFHKQDSISVQCVRDDSKRSRLVTVDAVVSYTGRSVLQTPQPMHRYPNRIRLFTKIGGDFPDR